MSGQVRLGYQSGISVNLYILYQRDSSTISLKIAAKIFRETYYKITCEHHIEVSKDIFNTEHNFQIMIQNRYIAHHYSYMRYN